MKTKLPVRLAGLLVLVATVMPAMAQNLGGMLKDTFKRAVTSEVQRKTDQETRRATRCALGDKRCASEQVAANGAQPGAAGSARGASDHPLIPRYEGSQIVHYESEAFTDYGLRTGKAKSSGTRMVEGKLTRITYQGPQDRSVLEVFRNYEATLREAGAQMLFTCAGAACGDIRKDIESDKRYMVLWGSGDHRYLAARLARGGSEVFVSLWVTKNASGGPARGRAMAQLDVVETKAMDDRMAAIDADALRRDLADGSATLYGIQFDSGTDRLRPEADEQIVQIAELLNQDRRLSIQVIGHTDGQGSESSNVALSERRAQRVVDRLNDLGVDHARLRARGLGESMPVASNDSEEGRALNRRVEIRR
ncbi:OmpA family protein [Pseudoxanthomonas sp. UTMC 1351]|uniref:OmpA family protein n=1 Tax=Pseudoxanthomonas sp. UTMC 1351 TaxID=2695853 RepID=UPI0034CD4207